jgi:hypothetical protein
MPIKFFIALSVDYLAKLLDIANFNTYCLKITLNYLLFSTYFTSVFQQPVPYGYNVIGQLQEPEEFIWLATAKIVFTIL